ncbi:hypothetical protein AAZX31_17G226600 [Glycine max]|uniref:Uncharacterized protein n=2 Tax=Glycine subgen. Soja TaxID=1462606 RepID=A0A0R0FTV1_SOYBN|nr:hypothetical protein GYH30_048307 [Glycine max]KRH05636.1 hypothetical protein GLYMA_17G239100v4 [Glycine max]
MIGVAGRVRCASITIGSDVGLGLNTNAGSDFGHGRDCHRKRQRRIENRIQIDGEGTNEGQI